MDRSVSASRVALNRVRAAAAGQRDQALERLAAYGIDARHTQSIERNLRASGRITLNFHPDRRSSSGRTVAAGLLRDGRYRPQSETGLSNGQRFAAPGGARTRWETELFGDAYDRADSSRPLYGALDVLRDRYGGSPRFGSSFVVLAPTCLDRATFCMGDSHVGPTDIGTIDQLTGVIAGLVEACAKNGFGRGLTVEKLLHRLASIDEPARSERDLDNYVEAQIHGRVELATDVASIVLDPSFEGTEVAADIHEAAERYGFRTGWNEGSELDPEQIDPAFRGPTIKALAFETTRRDGKVDAASIGRALASIPYVEPSIDGDPEDSPLQRYKKLWHTCLRYGTPATP